MAISPATYGVSKQLEHYKDGSASYVSRCDDCLRGE